MKRHKTNYRGVFYREADRLGGPGKERVYYIVFKKDGKVYEEKVGRQYADDMTPARAVHIRGERIEGKRLSRKEARERQAALKQAEAACWTITRLWQEYTVHRQIKGLAQDRSRFEKYIAPTWGEKEPHQIQPLEVDRLRLRILKDKAPQTAKLALALLCRIVNFGVKRQLCKPFSFHLELPKVNNRKTEDLTGEQLAALLEAIEQDPNLQAGNFMRLAMLTGMRRGELFRLQWADLDLQHGFIHLRTPKSGQDEKIPLNTAARALLEAHPRTDSPYVFPGRHGGQRVDITKQVNRIKEAAGLPKHFRALHGLRHVYASMLASSGEVDLFTLQKLLCHRSPSMTMRYSHLRDTALRRASELAGDLISQVINANGKVANLKPEN
jgi:integrase